MKGTPSAITPPPSFFTTVLLISYEFVKRVRNPFTRQKTFPRKINIRIIDFKHASHVQTPDEAIGKKIVLGLRLDSVNNMRSEFLDKEHWVQFTLGALRKTTSMCKLFRGRIKTCWIGGQLPPPLRSFHWCPYTELSPKGDRFQTCKHI